jgi:hypothetical protein
MPSLRDAIESRMKLSDYVPVPPGPPVISIIPLNSAPAKNLRCILPPFNSDPDTLRQFDNVSTGPKIRVMPRPQPKSSGNTITNKVTNVSAGTVSSTTSGGTTLATNVAVFTTSSLPIGVVQQSSIQLSQSFQMLNIASNGPCEVRLYGTLAAQSFDASRATDAPVPAEVISNIISCVIFDTAPYFWPWQNRIAANQDIPQTAAIYITVIGTNPASSAPVTLTIEFIPLET